MMLLRLLASPPQRSTLLRSVGIGSSLLMLSSLFLPWLLLPFAESIHCGHLPPLPPHCYGGGEEAVQVSLWQVFTQQVPQAAIQPITCIGMLPVGMAVITLALSFRRVQRHLLLARLACGCALIVGLLAQGMVTFLISGLSPLEITTVTDPSLLLALPYLVYLLMFLGGFALFSSPSHYEMRSPAPVA